MVVSGVLGAIEYLDELPVYNGSGLRATMVERSLLNQGSPREILRWG